MKHVLGFAAVAAAATLTLTACGEQDTAEPTSAPAAQPATTEASAPAAAPAAPAGIPAGYTEEDFYALFGSTESPGVPTVTPPQCTPLAFDSSTLVEWGAVPPEQKPVTMYTSAGEQVVFVRQDAELAGFDAAGCESFARENTTPLGTTVTTYTTAPIDVNVPGADRAQGFTQTVTGVTLDGTDMGAMKAGEQSTLLVVEAGGNTYFVAGGGGATVDDVTALAQANIAQG